MKIAYNTPSATWLIHTCMSTDIILSLYITVYTECHSIGYERSIADSQNLKIAVCKFVHHGVLVNNNTLCLSHPLSCENYPFNFQIARPLYMHILIKVNNWQLYSVIRHSVLHACMLVIYGWNICLICLFAWFVKFQILHIWKNVLEFLYSAQTTLLPTKS
jgi:hypothetical protein